MGIFKKLVDILSDEVEETEEESANYKEKSKHEKKENNKEKNEEPVKVVPKEKEERKEEKVEPERGLYQSKDTFKFPVFDDKDIEQTMQRSRSTSVLEYERTKPVDAPSIPSPNTTIRREEVRTEPVQEKKVFRPSPVISPVYGILDKNYTKEEIVDKKEEEQKSISKDNLNYDTVRRKAYGTLEDDLEDTLMSLNKQTMTKVESVQEDIEELSDPKKHIEKLLDELEKTASMTVGEIEEALKDELDDTAEIEKNNNIISEFDEVSNSIHSDVEKDLEFTSEFKPKEKVEPKEEKNNDQELENDLFNLIDSMYNEGDE